MVQCEVRAEIEVKVIQEVRESGIALSLRRDVNTKEKEVKAT